MALPEPLSYQRLSLTTPASRSTLAISASDLMVMRSQPVGVALSARAGKEKEPSGFLNTVAHSLGCHRVAFCGLRDHHCCSIGLLQVEQRTRESASQMRSTVMEQVEQKQSTRRGMVSICA